MGGGCQSGRFLLLLLLVGGSTVECSLVVSKAVGDGIIAGLGYDRCLVGSSKIVGWLEGAIESKRFS